MTLNIIFDLVILIIIGAGIVMGVARGFIETVAKPVRIIASFGIAFGLCRPAGEIYLQPIFQKPLEEKMSAFLHEKCASITAESAAEDLPGILKLVAKIFKVDIGQTANEAANSVIDSIVNSLAEPIASLGAVICAFFILLIAANIVCFILLKIIDAILNFGPLEVLNKIIGCVFGAVFAFLLAWTLTAGFDYVSTLDTFSDVAMIQEFTGGPIYRLVRSINPIDLLFQI